MLRGFGLRFDVPGVPYLEPAFASVQRAEGEQVFGVAVPLDAGGWRRVVDTEVGYVAVPVDVETDGGVAERAWTLLYPDARRRPNLPSQRYLDVLREGAREHGLDEVEEYLEAVPAYDGDRPEARVGALVALASLAPLAGPVGLAAAVGGATPDDISRGFGAATWWAHDTFWRQPFGHGGDHRP